MQIYLNHYAAFWVFIFTFSPAAAAVLIILCCYSSDWGGCCSVYSFVHRKGLPGLMCITRLFGYKKCHKQVGPLEKCCFIYNYGAVSPKIKRKEEVILN